MSISLLSHLPLCSPRNAHSRVFDRKELHCPCKLRCAQNYSHFVGLFSTHITRRFLSPTPLGHGGQGGHSGHVGHCGYWDWKNRFHEGYQKQVHVFSPNFFFLSIVLVLLSLSASVDFLQEDDMFYCLKCVSQVARKCDF